MPIQRVSFGAAIAAKQRAKRRRIVLASAVLLAVVFSFFWYQGALQPVNPGSDQRIMFDIAPGESATVILNRLHEKEVIRSALAAKIHLYWGGGKGTLQAGTFVLRQSMSLDEVLQALASGQTAESVVTIPEGTTVAEIDHLLASKGLAATGALLLCAKSCDLSAYPFLPVTKDVVTPGNRLEGFLFPDTYYVASQNFDVKAFVSRLLDTFQTRVVEGRAVDIQKSGKSVQQIMTMASLLEAESRKQEERKVVSGILWKRLDEGMQLGVDAATLYGAVKRAGPLTQSDLASNSPYNLRRARGLPPGPIGNPGLDAVDAALNPTDSPYFYYLHDAQGQVYYAKTLDEHNANKARYLP